METARKVNGYTSTGRALGEVFGVTDVPEAIVLTLLLTIAFFGQLLDTEVRFPARVDEIFYAPGANKLYVNQWRYGGPFWTTVMDCSTLAIHDSFPSGNGTPSGYALNPHRNKLYTNFTEDEKLYAVDVRTDSVIAEIPVHLPRSPIYNPANDRIYVGQYVGEVVVIDCATDSIVDTISYHLPISTISGALDSARNKLYVSAGGWGVDSMAVIDCNTDSIIKVFRSYQWPGPDQAVFAQNWSKLYATNRTWGLQVLVLDTETDSLTKRINVGEMDDVPMQLARSGNEVLFHDYSDSFPVGESIGVIDCALDSLVYRFGTGTPDSLWWCVDMMVVPWSSRLYMASVNCYQGTAVLTVADDETGELLGAVPTGRVPCSAFSFLAASPIMRRIYLANSGDSLVQVYVDSLVGAVSESPPKHASGDWHERPGPTVGRPRSVVVQGSVFTSSGRRIRTGDTGSLISAALPTGVYFIRSAEGGTTRKVVLLR